MYFSIICVCDVQSALFTKKRSEKSKQTMSICLFICLVIMYSVDLPNGDSPLLFIEFLFGIVCTIFLADVVVLWYPLNVIGIFVK